MRAESSPAARTGVFIAVAVALFCIQLDFLALNLAVPGIADEFGARPDRAGASAALTLAVQRGSAWGWDRARTLTLPAVTVVAGGLFVRRERRARHPLIDLRHFRNTPYVLFDVLIRGTAEGPRRRAVRPTRSDPGVPRTASCATASRTTAPDPAGSVSAPVGHERQAAP